MSKGFKITLSSLVIILIVVVTALIVVLTVSSEEISSDSDDATQPIADMVKYSFDTEEITTDLQDGSFVRMQFRIIADGDDSLEEVSQRDFQITNILIKELSVMSTEDFSSNLDELEDTLQVKLNELMTDGEITDVYTITKILQ